MISETKILSAILVLNAAARSFSLYWGKFMFLQMCLPVLSYSLYLHWKGLVIGIYVVYLQAYVQMNYCREIEKKRMVTKRNLVKFEGLVLPKGTSL